MDIIYIYTYVYITPLYSCWHGNLHTTLALRPRVVQCTLQVVKEGEWVGVTVLPTAPCAALCGELMT